MGKLYCVSARVPKELLEKMRETVQKEGYANVSDYIRNMLREKLMKN